MEKRVYVKNLLLWVRSTANETSRSMLLGEIDDIIVYVKNGQATLDDVYRRNKLSYKIKIVEIGLVVGAQGFLQGLPLDNVQTRSAFSISFENGWWCGADDPSL
ncbi:hypothetical protein AVEN_30223-1 [Araneus ventricosus]|uniref:Uncharacterized protein n=1 Tax=Araneus ventricosus TaxID=182803 RepID=A0A4Y2LHY1_ARAVE|nr:hypothetical protein AVEN_30223-1 [Araneus ventricosus]